MTNPNQAPTVRIKGRDVQLIAPDPFVAISLSRSSADLQADQALSIALWTAALRECWPDTVAWPGQLPRRWSVGKQRMEQHGADIFNALVRSGVPADEVIAAAAEAWRWAVGSIVTAEAVESARGNSEAPTGG